MAAQRANDASGALSKARWGQKLRGCCQEVQDVLAWRDANMPDAPVHVTEWGWSPERGSAWSEESGGAVMRPMVIGL